MNHASAVKLIDVQIENALRILNLGFGVNHAEAIFFDVIRLLRENDGLKAYFLSRVEETFLIFDFYSLESGVVPSDLIELVAHEFRWVELSVLAKKRIDVFFNGNFLLAVGDVSYSIEGAFNEDWPDREFYRHYQVLCNKSSS